MPLFYTRTSDGLPRGWLKMMKRSISTHLPVLQHQPHGAGVRREVLLAVGAALRACCRPTDLKQAAQPGAVAAAAGAGLVGGPGRGGRGATAPIRCTVGGQLEVQARVHLGGLSPDDVEVQLFHGVVDSFGDIPNPRTVPMSHNGKPEGRRRLGLPGDDPVPLERPARLRGARAAQARRPGQSVRAGAADVGMSLLRIEGRQYVADIERVGGASQGLQEGTGRLRQKVEGPRTEETPAEPAA